MFFHSHRRVQLYIWSNWPPKMTSRSSLLSKKEMYAASYIHRWGLWDVGRQRITQWQGHTAVWLAFLRRNVCKINISTNRWGKKLSLAKPRCRESVGTWDCPACRVLFIIQYFFFFFIYCIFNPEHLKARLCSLLISKSPLYWGSSVYTVTWLSLVMVQKSKVTGVTRTLRSFRLIMLPLPALC